jgi:succinate dehydrogenase / fumarate reductase iron-sulfur subunit
MELTFNIRRGDANRKAGTFQAYKVEDVPPETTVFDALARIREEQDGSLAFRGTCSVGFCGDCTMRVNGKQVVSCLVTTGKVQKDGEIKVEPIRNAPITKDVMYDIDRFLWTKAAALSPGLVSNGHAEATDEELRPVRKAMRCTMCGLCDEGCTVIDINLDFLGPAALTKAYRYVMDPRDTITKDRLVEAGEPQGVWDCVHCWEASEHCPFGIDPTHRIMELRDRSLALGIKSGTRNVRAARHYDAFERSVERSGWLDERALAIYTYGGLIKGTIKLMPTGLKALRRGKASLMPHRKRPGAGEIRKLFERHRQVLASQRKESTR